MKLYKILYEQIETSNNEKDQDTMECGACDGTGRFLGAGRGELDPDRCPVCHGSGLLDLNGEPIEEP